MGVSSSKIEDDKALLLCRERKRFVKQMLDGRCSLAAAHVAYIHSLRNTGAALKKFVEPDAQVDSSLYTSTSATPEPLALTDKSLSQFSYSSPSPSQHVESVEPLSPGLPSPNSGQFQVSYMRTVGTSLAKVEERPPVCARVKLMPPSATPQNHTPRSTENHPSFEDPSPPPGTSPWDYFGLFDTIDSQFSFHDERTLNHELENADDIQRLREEEGIPDLEDAGACIRTQHEISDDNESSVSMSLQSLKKDNDRIDSNSNNVSPKLKSTRSITHKVGHLNGEDMMPKESMDVAAESETPDMAPSKDSSLVTLPTDENRGMVKKSTSQNKLAPRDFLSSIKEIEYLFIKASESGNEVPRMLEANKVQHRPIFPETKARRSSASVFFKACLFCFEDSEHISQEPATSAVKYLTWNRSVSSRSSSSRNPLASTSKDSIGDSSSSLFNSFCMNSGSHASTLDRLYAWERKLYDEIKASEIIRKEYDMKCKLLRHQESKVESPYKVDKTRAIVKDLHSRIRVAIHRINTISKKIEELRDKELEPQLEELIESSSRMWEMILDYHKLQFNIISIAYNDESSKISVHSESHQHATIHLENELKTLSLSLTKWIGMHKSYLQAINGWLLKCVVFPLQRKSSRRRQMPFSPRRYIAPPIFIICRDWLKGLEDLEKKEEAVIDSIRKLLAVTTRFLPQQEKAHRRNPSSTLSSVPWDDGDHSETVQTHTYESTMDWNSGFHSLQSSLVGFFNQLSEFADSSVKMYSDLQKSIKEAHYKYDPTMPSRQM